MRVSGWAVLLTAVLSGCGSQGPADVDQKRLANAEAEPGNWMTHGRTWEEDRFSTLENINRDNIQQLGAAWTYEFKVGSGAQATPLVVDGVMYVSSAWSIVYALDAATGKELWVYDPEVPRSRQAQSCCGPANRGVALWKGKVYVGTFDGRLVALDAKNGSVLWEKVTVDQAQPYTITGAPRAANGLIYIGNGGAELGVRGYVSAYDADTGALRWRFHTTPNPKGPDNAASDNQRERMLSTWNPEAGAWHKLGGGGTAWDALVYDNESDTLWIGVGNGSPWNLEVRSPTIAGRNNDNLFLSSIVAVDAKTGRYKCHYQQNPASSWDYTATQPMILTTLKINGKSRKVLLQAPKNGNFYVIDRTNCGLISAGAFATQTWTDGIDMKTGRPKVRDGAHYRGKPALILPSGFGAHSWHPMAMSRQTGLVYIPVQEIPEVMYEENPFIYRAGRFNTGTTEPILANTPEEQQQLRQATRGFLVAWDPVKQKAAWKVPLTGAVNGGTLGTAGGLVFQGTMEGRMRAYDAWTGRLLWDAENGAATFAGPITYMVNGEQYLATLAGYGTVIYLAAGLTMDKIGDKSNGRVIVYKLGGKVKVPSTQTDPGPMPEPPVTSTNPMQIRRGALLYSQNCIFCHGIGVIGGGVIQDLRRSAVLQDAEAWKLTLHGGRLDEGMPNFKAWIGDADAEAIRIYVSDKARQEYQRENAQRPAALPVRGGK